MGNKLCFEVKDQNTGNVTRLRVDDRLTYEQLKNIFHCANAGGMLYARRTDTLVLIMSFVNGPYKDQDDVDGIHWNFIGMGQEGDQDIEWRQNRRLNHANDKNSTVKVHLFEHHAVDSYTYKGRVKLDGEVKTARQRDKKGKMRNVLVFPLRRYDEVAVKE